MWCPDTRLTKTWEETNSRVYIKRSDLSNYDIFSKHHVVHLISKGLLDEAESMQTIASQPHPSIVTYRGCRVRRGYITGLVFEKKHPYDLTTYLMSGQKLQSNDLFIKSLRWAIDHLHSLSWVHNGLNPSNILVAADGRPNLIDFGSARKIGQELSTSRGTKGWIDGEMKDHTISKVQNDTSALLKIVAWLKSPKFDEGRAVPVSAE